MNDPAPAREFPIGETEAFVVGALAGASELATARSGAGPGLAPLRILEVGAGDGALAERLARRGLTVTALERSPDRASAARRRGVSVIEADFMGPDGPPYPAAGSLEALLFTRVLHHLDPLAAALDRAASLLAPGGLVVGEEFAWERADSPGLAWLAARRERASALGLVPAARDATRESLEAWRHHHQIDHRVHRGEDLARAVPARFELLRLDSAPYLYRYLCSDLAETPAAAEFAHQTLAEERRAIEGGRFAAVGLRFVGRRRDRRNE